MHFWKWDISSDGLVFCGAVAIENLDFLFLRKDLFYLALLIMADEKPWLLFLKWPSVCLHV